MIVETCDVDPFRVPVLMLMAGSLASCKMRFACSSSVTGTIFLRPSAEVKKVCSRQTRLLSICLPLRIASNTCWRSYILLLSSSIISTDRARDKGEPNHVLRKVLLPGVSSVKSLEPIFKNPLDFVDRPT